MGSRCVGLSAALSVAFVLQGCYQESPIDDLDLTELPSTEEVALAEEALARVDPVVLSLATADARNLAERAAIAMTTDFLTGDLDLEVEDYNTALLHYVSAAANDPSPLPATLMQSIIPKPECTDLGCAYSAKCRLPYIPSVNHRCFVTDCGPARCPTCPGWINDLLRNVVHKAWCSYVCVQTGTTPPKVVAIGAGFVSPFRNTFGGPLCMKAAEG